MINEQGRDNKVGAGGIVLGIVLGALAISAVYFVYFKP